MHPSPPPLDYRVSPHFSNLKMAGTKSCIIWNGMICRTSGICHHLGNMGDEFYWTSIATVGGNHGIMYLNDDKVLSTKRE